MKPTAEQRAEYLERQRKWVAEIGLVKGDRVKVLRKADDYEDGWPDEWGDHMGEIIGRAVEVYYPDDPEYGVLIVWDMVPQGQMMADVPYFILEKV